MIEKSKQKSSEKPLKEPVGNACRTTRLKDKEDKRAAALRENLKRRKDQKKEREREES